MSSVSRRQASIALLGAACTRAQADEAWIPLFDGKSLSGWKASEHGASWRVKDGCLTASGPRSHLFYSGPVRNARFKNFDFRAQVMLPRGANSGVYFHTEFQTNGWPFRGFEVQLNNSHVGEGNYRERKKTGSLYGVRNIYRPMARDGEWFPLRIEVRGYRVRIWVNEILAVDYAEPDPPFRAVADMDRTIGSGTFALQCHDAHSPVAFRDLMVQPLPDDAAPSALRPQFDEIDWQLLRMGAQNYPVVDYHVHLKGNFSLEEALAESRRVGIQYGLAINVGINFSVRSDEGALGFAAMLKDKPVFIGLQGEGREWPALLSKETIAQFDYVFADAMTFTDDNGRRIRLWIKDEVGSIRDPEAFVDMYLNRIVGVLEREPIDIYAAATFLPEVIAPQYDRLWTPARMQRVIRAAKTNEVAIEISNRYKIPSPAFIRMAKAAGCRFSFGTNNGTREVGRMEYALAMVKECDLTWRDIFIPKPDGQKPVQIR